MKLLGLVSVCCCVFVIANGKDCALYEGFHDSHCFWGEKLTEALTWSPTVWLVEFYSSWCGHCQHFAPSWKEVATRVKGWSSIVRIGEIDCSDTVNSDTCRKYDVRAYPSMKLIPPRANNPTSIELQDFIGSRSPDSIVKFIIDYVAKLKVYPPLKLIESNKVDSTLNFLFFEKRDSHIGSMIILDLITEKDIHIGRVLDDNVLTIPGVYIIALWTPGNTVALVRQFSILFFPSLVLLLPNDKYTVVSGKTIPPNDDVTEYFKNQIHHFIGSDTSSPLYTELQRKSDVPTKPHPQNTHIHISRPTLMDIKSAISYSLRMEVKLYHVISDKSFAALLRFISLLENTLQFSQSSLSSNMKAIRTKLESKSLAGFILVSEWDRLLESKLDPDLFPVEPQWSSCAGSQPQYRGYPCGLWSLMHTVTVLSLSLPDSSIVRPINLLTSSRESLYGMVEFIKQFFSCEECRKHFTKLAGNLRSRPISYDGDAILWLWEAHNIVSKRLKDEPMSDPTHPKLLFPPYQVCPDCYTRVVNSSRPLNSEIINHPSWGNVGFVPGDSLLQMPTSTQSVEYHWNKSAVLLFLVSFYGMGHFNDVSSSALLRAAWPRQFVAHGRYPKSVQTSYDYKNSAVFLAQFLACVLLLAFILSFTLRYKLSRRSISRHSFARYKML